MLEKLKLNDFNKVFKLMEESFPKSEYRPYDEQKALLNERTYEIFVLQNSADDEIEAFIAVWEFASFVFIEHFAVNPKYRNCGLGGRVLSEFVGSVDKAICLEVEPPLGETSIRRIKFYERNKFILNNYSYMQPAISKGFSPIPLLIMTYGRAVDEKEFELIKQELYKKVYKVK